MIKELVKDCNKCWGNKARRGYAAIVLWVDIHFTAMFLTSCSGIRNMLTSLCIATLFCGRDAQEGSCLSKGHVLAF